MEKPLPDINFVDINADVIEALHSSFKNIDGVQFLIDDILRVAQHIVISPANSYGFMDGGVDFDYMHYFGASLQNKVLNAVRARPEGYLPVGAAEWIETGDDRIPSLILAPTMLHPEMIPPINVLRAFRAALKLFLKKNVCKSVYCPGFGTGVGGVPPDVAAEMMLMAYQSF